MACLCLLFVAVKHDFMILAKYLLLHAKAFPPIFAIFAVEVLGG